MHAQPIHTHSLCVRLLRREARQAVLLADGGADLHDIFGAVLKHQGYRVIHAFSAAECLRLAGARPVRAVLVSVGSCGLLTWRGLHLLAARAAEAGFVIVCMTTDPRLSSAMRRRPPGTSSVLMIPCDPEALAAEVRRAVRDHGAPPN